MVLVAWADPGTAGLDDDGSSGSASTVRVLAPSGQSVLVAGQVVLNRHHSHLYRGRLGQALLEHELGHLLGLAHVDDPIAGQYPLLGDVDRLASGDRAGLRAAGRGGCPAATPP